MLNVAPRVSCTRAAMRRSMRSGFPRLDYRDGQQPPPRPILRAGPDDDPTVLSRHRRRVYRRAPRPGAVTGGGAVTQHFDLPEIAIRGDSPRSPWWRGACGKRCSAPSSCIGSNDTSAVRRSGSWCSAWHSVWATWCRAGTRPSSPVSWEPGSTPRLPPSRRSPGLSPGRGARRGRRRGSRPRARGRRARRRGGRASRSTPGGCSRRGRPRRGVGRAASGARGRPRRDGSGRGNPSSPPQTFDPRVAGFGDPDLEAVEAGRELAVRRDPDDEGVDHAPAAVPRAFSPASGRWPPRRPGTRPGRRGGRARPRTRRSRSVPGWGRAASGSSPRRASPRAAPR